MLKLSDFYDDIRNREIRDERPLENNTVSKSYYNLPGSISTVVEDFAPQSVKKVSLSRNDIFDETNTKRKIIKILVWGYSGDSRHIGTKALSNHLDELVSLFDKYRGQEISKSVIEKFFKIGGIGRSTASKILYFMKTTIKGYPSIIVDSRVIEALPLFEELQDLPKGDSVDNYSKVVERIGDIAKKASLDADRIEYFLFNCGIVWNNYLNNLIKDLKSRELQKADYHLLHNLFDIIKKPTSEKPMEDKQNKPKKYKGRDILYDCFERIGDFNLFLGKTSFEFCEIYIEKEGVNIDKELSDEIIRLFPILLKHCRYHKFATETEQEKIQFFRDSKALLEKLLAENK